MEEPPANARKRARDLLRRTAPVLRDVNAAIDQHGALRDTRDALVERAGELVQRADDALGKMTAIEGTVVEERRGPTSDGAGTTPATDAPTAKPTPDSTVREPHWNRTRVARMARAAAVEAVRPARSPLADTRVRVGIGAGVALLVAVLLRRRRR